MSSALQNPEISFAGRAGECFITFLRVAFGDKSLLHSAGASRCAMTVEKTWRLDSLLRNTVAHAAVEGDFLI